jgi:hypothetical protein
MLFWHWHLNDAYFFLPAIVSYIVQTVSKRRYIKSPVELCGSIILLCWTMLSRWSRQIRHQQSNVTSLNLSVSCEFKVLVYLWFSSVFLYSNYFWASILFIRIITVILFLWGALCSFLFFIKLVFISFLRIWVRGTLPRFRGLTTVY